LKYLNDYVKKKVGNRAKIQAQLRKYQKKTKTEVFKVLICPEFYTSKEPTEYQIHELYLLKNVMRELPKVT
jgi:hypothetical protein